MTLSTSRILLKKGVLLIHDKDGNVNPVRSDLLVEGDKIVQISDDIEASGDHVKVFDCEGKVISPGFISTHHHVWQTALKGRHANHSLLEYLPTGSYAGALYSADDAFWGELGGALEAIDGGTTTVVDHSSLNVGPSTDDYTSPDVLVPWKSLASNGPYGDGRIQLGFAVDNVHQSPDEMKKLYSELRAAKAKVITSHSAGGLAYGNGPSVAQLLEGHGLLGPDILVSHAISPRDGDAGLFAKRDAHISSTPNTELQAGAPPSSLGVDCHSWGSSFMPSQMRLGLQHARTERCADLGRQGKWSRHVGPSAEQVFNLATIGGARAIGMAGEVGQIRVGAKADLVIFDTGSPSMLPAAEEDPVAAIVLHSSERDVETVIVGGVIRKEDGKLMPVSVAHEVPGAIDLGLVGKEITWKDVAKELLESRKRLNEKVEGIDMKAAEEVVITNFYMNRKDMVEQA
ncbi:amidohydrolase [Colletotrichum higginsianum]|nr:amidohydrolase [Colletotrichum higginsianum]